MRSTATTVAEYLAGLPAERREAPKVVRAVILRNLPEGYAEGMQYGMIGYFVPHAIYPAGYHCNPAEPLPFASLAAQKHHLAIYLLCLYGDPEHRAWFIEEWKKTGRKLDIGKGCLRFKTLDDIPLGLIGRAIKRVPVRKFITFYEATITAHRAGVKATRTGKRVPTA